MRLLVNLRKLALLGLMVFLSISLLRGTIKIFEAKERVKREKEKTEKLAVEQEVLKEKLSFVQSPEYIEKNLRDKLGYSKEGEIILVLPDAETLKKLAPELPEEENVLPDPPWKKWAHLFGL